MSVCLSTHYHLKSWQNPVCIIAKPCKKPRDAKPAVINTDWCNLNRLFTRSLVKCHDRRKGLIVSMLTCWRSWGHLLTHLHDTSFHLKWAHAEECLLRLSYRFIFNAMGDAYSVYFPCCFLVILLWIHKHKKEPHMVFETREPLWSARDLHTIAWLMFEAGTTFDTASV